MKLEVWDSPNSAGIVIDAVRFCKLALNHGRRGPARRAVSSYLMKSPHNQRPDDEAREMTEEFIAEYAGLPGTRSRDARCRRRPSPEATGSATMRACSTRSHRR